MKKIDRVMSSIMALITAINMSGCAKKINCDVSAKHYHLYECSVDDDVSIKKYFSGERESNSERDLEFDVTDYYSFKTSKLKTIIDNDLAYISDNYEYLSYLVDNGYKDENDGWIFYIVTNDNNVFSACFDSIQVAINTGYYFFKCNGNMDDLIYHEKGKSLVRSIE